ncbi:MAG: hypothetical protein J6D08_12425 [Lachnospiraceae bacterium]|nr:hypothetical protein [Lachnospiraceae bacterium]
MKICPKCGKQYDRLLAVSRINPVMHICDECGTKEALDAAGLTEGSLVRESILKEAYRKKNPYKRKKSAVAAIGNRVIKKHVSSADA